MTGTSPPFNFGFNDTVTGFLLTDDDTMIASYGETLAIVDLGYFALAAEQPPPLDIDADTDGRLTAIAYSSARNRVYAPQDDGDCLNYDLSNITVDPGTVTIAESTEMGAIAIDNNAQNAYIINKNDNTVNVLDLAVLAVGSIIPLTIPSVTAFNVTAAAHDSLTNEIYFLTDKGVVFFMEAAGLGATAITIDPANAANLTAAAVTPNGLFVYVTNQTENTVVKLDANTHAIVTEIDFTENPAPTGIAITEVTNPTATYAYVAGSKGVSVINMADDVVLDMGTDPAVAHEPIPMSVVPKNVTASSAADGYVYTANATQTVGIISANPWVTISSLTYSGGGSSMGLHESFTIAFQADEMGTAELRSGGDVSGNGTLLVDSTGVTSFPIATIDTDVTVTVNYDDNTSAFIEGANEVFVFVTDAEGNTGRMAATVNVDTPPPAPQIRSTGFGNASIYVTFDRLDVADMNNYNIYVDTDPAAVLTKTEIAASPAQAASGDTQEAKVSGLTNSLTYYIAMEAVDAGGNVSLTRSSTFPDGSPAFAIPQETGGPCEFAGETGCSLMRVKASPYPAILISLSLALLVVFRIGKKKASILILVAATLISSEAFAKEPSSQWWSLEVKTGFWMPKNGNVGHFFGDCCNLITRIQGGLLAHGRYGAEAGVGFFVKDGQAAGLITGEESQDSFNFFMMPFETNFVWRVDYWNWDYFLPYLKAGVDYVFFRENLQGKTTKGLKFGMHGVIGAQLNLKVIDEDAMRSLDDDLGINDMFLTFEAQYQYINNFGGKGLNLSGPVFSIGFLFEF